MSLILRKLAEGKKNLSRLEILALHPVLDYTKDGKTKQCFKDECDINKIMSRYTVQEAATHLSKFQGSYSDYSDYDFHEQTRMLTRGREIFDELPAEVRREFGQSPQKFFAYVNDPANINDLHKKIPGLAKPGDQLVRTQPPNADEAAAAAAKEPEPPADPPADSPADPPAS